MPPTVASAAPPPDLAPTCCVPRRPARGDRPARGRRPAEQHPAAPVGPAPPRRRHARPRTAPRRHSPAPRPATSANSRRGPSCSRRHSTPGTPSTGTDVSPSGPDSPAPCRSSSCSTTRSTSRPRAGCPARRGRRRRQAELVSVREELTETLRLATKLTPRTPARQTRRGAGRRPPSGTRARGRPHAPHRRDRERHRRAPRACRAHRPRRAHRRRPSGSAGSAGEDPVLLATGDVVAPVAGRAGATARVVDEATAGAALGAASRCCSSRPAALDLPRFLAGFLRGTANNRQASSYAATATRLDVRRLQPPRLPCPNRPDTASGSEGHRRFRGGALRRARAGSASSARPGPARRPHRRPCWNRVRLCAIQVDNGSAYNPPVVPVGHTLARWSTQFERRHPPSRSEPCTATAMRRRPGFRRPEQQAEITARALRGDRRPDGRLPRLVPRRSGSPDHPQQGRRGSSAPSPESSSRLLGRRLQRSGGEESRHLVGQCRDGPDAGRTSPCRSRITWSPTSGTAAGSSSVRPVPPPVRHAAAPQRLVRLPAAPAADLARRDAPAADARDASTRPRAPRRRPPQNQHRASTRASTRVSAAT